MAVGSGLAGSVGIAAEATYGTYVAPSRFLEPSGAVPLKKVKNVAQGGGLAAGRLAAPGARRVVTSEAATATLPVEVTTSGMGLLLRHIMGGVPVPTQVGATAAWQLAAPLADNVGSSLTLQVGVPDAGGVVRPYTGKGGKVTSAEFSCGVDDLLTVQVEMDMQRLTEVETLAAPSYVARRPFHFGNMGLRLGTVGAETAVQGVKKVSLKIERKQATDRFYANQAGTAIALKAQPLMNDWVEVSGSIEVDLITKADFADRFSSDSDTSLVWEFLGGAIAASVETFRLTVADVFFDGETPSLDGPGLVSGTVPFVGRVDATNPLISLLYISTDTTL